MRNLPPARASGSRRAVALAWLAVAAWVGFIGTLSGDAFSADATGGPFRALLRWLQGQLGLGAIGPGLLDASHFLLRKGAHAAEYGLLAILAQRAFRLSFPLASPRVALLSLVFALAVASADETHQAFLPARGGAPADVALDLAGAALGLALLAGLRRAGRGGSRPSSARA